MMYRLFGAAVCVAVFVCCGAYAQAPDLSQMDVVLRSIPDGPVARVGRMDIPADEFRELYISQLMRARQINEGRGIPDIARIEMAVNSLRVLVERAILLQEAEDRGLDVPQEKLEEEWTDELERLGRAFSEDPNTPLGEEELLGLAGVGRDVAMGELREALLVEKMKQTILEERGVTVSDEEARQFYEEHRDAIRQPDMAHLHQIFIMVEGQQRENAQEQAEQSLRRLRAGESFSAVARSVSSGIFADTGGDMGNVPVERLPEVLQETIMRLEPNQISDVIESEYGFHIIRLEERIPGREPSFEDVKEEIRHMLLMERGQQEVHEFCAKVSNSPNYIRVFWGLEREIERRPELRSIFEAIQEPQP